jgi:hypothetical protein
MVPGRCEVAVASPSYALGLGNVTSAARASQKTQADVLLHRLHYALPGWDTAAERRDAQDEFHSAAQARTWVDGDFDADHGFAFDGVGRSAH